WDSVDRQILGQLRPLADAEATCPLGPAFPGMGSEELRLASFHNWLLSFSVHPAQRAKAGFFHTGPQVKVRCFFCCGGLQSWERRDDPWTEHAKWFPRCEFLLQSKGRRFVHSIQDSYSRVLGPWDPLEELGDAASTVPTAPVHWSPDLPTLRRDSHLEGTEDSGVCSPAWGQAGWETPPPPGAESTEEQLRHLRQERTCKVYLDQAVAMVFMPCSHLVCAECAPNLCLCPICWVPIHSCVHTFLS
uniref:RING-type E3 ubiquitin transferase n=1 Tax=Loxodonta africana TaxID=9785 RepID=G3ULG6_LOXAF